MNSLKINALIASYELLFGLHPAVAGIVERFKVVKEKLLSNMTGGDGSLLENIFFEHLLPDLNKEVMRILSTGNVTKFTKSKALFSFLTSQNNSGKIFSDLFATLWSNALPNHVIDNYVTKKGFPMEIFNSFSKNVTSVNPDGKAESKQKLKYLFREILINEMIEKNFVDDEIALFMKLHPLLDKETRDLITAVKKRSGIR